MSKLIIIFFFKVINWECFIWAPLTFWVHMQACECTQKYEFNILSYFEVKINFIQSVWVSGYFIWDKGLGFLLYKCVFVLICGVRGILFLWNWQRKKKMGRDLPSFISVCMHLSHIISCFLHFAWNKRVNVFIDLSAMK